ncbi:hypothetical protein B0H21DRAFT_786976 [Amylocystis lapponica]|nr:hypothetical protein B0H21DRAFT_786976 [Amylocystis lapponica]
MHTEVMLLRSADFANFGQLTARAPAVGHWKAILVLVLFVISNVAVVFPIRLPVPQAIIQWGQNILIFCRVLPRRSGPPPKAKHIHLDFITVPLFSVILLLITGAINGAVVRDGIVGANGVKPLDIMALFLSLAYLSISLDATGLLRFLAFWVVRKGGSSGRRLFAYLYVFFLAYGVIVGNDPVILSGTAFLAYLTRISGITNPTAWIFSQFAAANMVLLLRYNFHRVKRVDHATLTHLPAASVVLVSSNQTNLVLAGAFSLSFTTYTAHCILPFLFAAVFVYLVLALGLFRSPDMVPPSVDIDIASNEDIGTTLIDQRGAIFGSVLLLVTLGVLVGTSVVGVPVWEVTVPPAVIMLLRDLHHDWTTIRLPEPEPECPPDCRCYDVVIEPYIATELSLRTSELPSQASPASPTIPQQDLSSLIERCFVQLTSPFPTVMSIVRRLPFPLVPFAFLMFILVQGLSARGWVDVFAVWWAAWIRKTGTLGAVGGMGFLTCIACNVCGTNIGATILLARVLQLWAATSSPDARTKEGAIYALALGSNYGAFTFTFSASLAGLLWRRILDQKGIHVRATQFLWLNISIAFTAMTVSSLVLVGQLYVVYRNK